MKKGLFVFVLLSLLSFISPQNEFKILKGEKITYSVKFGESEVGQIDFLLDHQFHTIQNTSCYKAIVNGRSIGPLDYINKVRDQFESYFSKTFKSKKFTMTIQENQYKREQSIDFQNNKAIVNNISFPVSSGTQDAVSVFYTLRNLPFHQMKKGDKKTIQVFYDGKNYSGEIQFIMNDKINTLFGEKNTYKIQLKLPQHPLLESNYAYMWITADEYRVPLKIEVKSKGFGAITINLKEYQKGK